MPSFTQELAALNSIMESGVTDVSQFVPNDGGQQRFIETLAHEIIFAGANSCGKTYSGLIKCAHHILPEKDVDGKNTGFTIHPHRRIRLKPNGIEGWVSSWSEKTQRSNMKPLIDRILGPYEIDKKVVGGVRQESHFETGRIIYKWQTQNVSGYTGDKMDFIHMDEPHRPVLYNEALARLPARRGTMWTTATFVAGDHYSDTQLADVIWMQETYVSPFLRSPEAFLPFTEVIFASTAENKGYIDIDFIEKLFARMSQDERTTRLTGHIISHFGQCLFDEDRLISLIDYLQTHPEQSTPRYCELEYENGEVIPVDVVRDSFPEKPKGEYIVKIWQMPLDRSGLLTPKYYIGVDAAEGKRSGDYTAVSIIRGDTGEEVAALHGHISEVELAKQLWLLGTLYRDAEDKLPFLGIEVNNIGKTTCSYLLTGNRELGIPKYGASRLYRRPRPGDLERGVAFIGTEPGWLTTARSRHYLLTAMRRIVIEACDSVERQDYSTIKDLGLLAEARWFVLSSNGKYEAKGSISHDDRLFARAIAEMVKDQYGGKKRPVEGLEEASKDFYTVDMGTGRVTYNMDNVRPKKDTGKRALYL